jgi:ABC-type dipeptide transport system, periplasmic component
LFSQPWSIPTYTEFTFKLRKGITFHDGAPFNAQAVKVNIDRLMTGKYVRSSLMAPVKEVKIIDDYTVKFILKEPFGAFLNALAHPGALMLSPKALQEYGDDVSKHPVGTGPFMFSEMVSGSYVLIKKIPITGAVPSKSIPSSLYQSLKMALVLLC